MGILNNKERILDTIITLEGRKQIVGGNLQIKFAAFSDRYTFYRGDILSGSDDASKRLFFEAASLPSDQITFEADDSGRLIQNNPAGSVKVKLGKLTKDSSYVTDSSIYASTANGLLSSSVDHFNNLRLIGSNDFFRDDKNFVISDNEIDFSFTDEYPISEQEIQSISIDKVDSFFQDKRLSHIPNFKFLPPKNKQNISGVGGKNLGQYMRLGQKDLLSLDELKKDLKRKEFHNIEFSETSRLNNIFAQFFEITPNEIKKLDVIDFGSFPSEDGDEHIFFVGKIYIDSLNRSTFINLFTLVFS